MSGVRIAPGHIVSGLGGLDRAALSELLAVLEETNLRTLLGDRLEHARASLKQRTRDGAKPRAASHRHGERAAAWHQANASDSALRLRLWSALRDSLGLAPEVPFSTRAAGPAAADMAHASARTLASALPNADDVSTGTGAGETAHKAWQRVHNLIGGQKGPPDFTRIAEAQASRLVAEAARQGSLSDEAEAELASQIRDRLASLPITERDAAIEHALRGGDQAAVGLLASGTSLVGLGIAVDLAGFSAYVLAAQVSGIVPLLGGKVAVSTLAVLANPVFAVGAIAGGGYAANRHIRANLRRQVAGGITVLLALNGLSTGRDGQRACVESLRDLDSARNAHIDAAMRERLERKHRRMAAIVGDDLPPAPGAPPANAALGPSGPAAHAVARDLFKGDTTTAREALLVGGLTLGDIVADAAAIDPHVVNAADFSRQQDLEGLLAFGAFAEDVNALTGAAATGAHANLQGYVAEQLVATRLVEQGHQVALPDDARQFGYDIIVDGTLFQIKCADDPAILEEHFAAYPEIPVLANTELVQAVADTSAPWADKVFPVEGFDQALTNHIVETSLAAGADLGDLPVPVFALGVAAARHLHGWWRGSMPLSDLPFEIALDGALKGSLTLAGTTAAKATGLVLLGPAGGIVLGSAGGASALFAAPTLRQWADQRIWQTWHADVELAAAEFEATLRDALYRKLAILRDKTDAIEVGASSEKAWVKQRFCDDTLAIAEGIHDLETRSSGMLSTDRARTALQLMTRTGTHPCTVQATLTRLCQTLQEKPSVARMTRLSIELVTDLDVSQ